MVMGIVLGELLVEIEVFLAPIDLGLPSSSGNGLGCLLRRSVSKLYSSHGVP